jgi:hypothetical protein
VGEPAESHPETDTTRYESRSPPSGTALRTRPKTTLMHGLFIKNL